jgi:hypothetical protein
MILLAMMLLLILQPMLPLNLLSDLLLILVTAPAAKPAVYLEGGGLCGDAQENTNHALQLLYMPALCSRWSLPSGACEDSTLGLLPPLPAPLLIRDAFLSSHLRDDAGFGSSMESMFDVLGHLFIELTRSSRFQELTGLARRVFSFYIGHSRRSSVFRSPGPGEGT